MNEADRLTDWLAKWNRFFPVSHSVTAGEPATLLASFLIYLAGAGVSWLILSFVLGRIPGIGAVFHAGFVFFTLYCMCGMIDSMLLYFRKI